MFRARNTNRSAGSFDAATVELVWKKATIMSNNDPGVFRKDSCGARIKRSSYGTTGDYGWEIDHNVPVSLGGSDALSNLQPLHWKNNRHKGDDYPSWGCLVSAK